MQFGVDSLGMITRARFANNSYLYLYHSIKDNHRMDNKNQIQNWIFSSESEIHKTKAHIISHNNNIS